MVAAVRASRADSTRRVYDCYTRQWADWCAARGISAQGAGPVEVSAWLQEMHAAGASSATVRTARAALSHHHRTLAMLLAAGGAEIAAAPDPAASELVAATVAGLSRSRSRPRARPPRSAGMTWPSPTTVQVGSPSADPRPTSPARARCSTSPAGLVELQTAGRWASPRMPAHYTRNHAAGRGAVARYARQTGAT